MGISITLNFIVNQNVRDAYLLESFIRVFDCGSLYITEKTGIARFTVVNFTDIVEKIIPFFDEYPIFGSKYKDFQYFKQASILIKSKSHLTKQGLEQILLIKAGMNFKREWFSLKLFSSFKLKFTHNYLCARNYLYLVEQL